MKWRSVPLSEILNANLSLAPKDYIMDTSINGGTMKEQNTGEYAYLRKGLDVALELLSDSDLEEWNSRMGEE